MSTPEATSGKEFTSELDLRHLAAAPAIQKIALLVRQENIPLRDALEAMNERFGCIGKHAYIASRGDESTSQIKVIAPDPKDPWWPQIDENRFQTVNGRN